MLITKEMKISFIECYDEKKLANFNLIKDKLKVVDLKGLFAFEQDLESNAEKLMRWIKEYLISQSGLSEEIINSFEIKWLKEWTEDQNSKTTFPKNGFLKANVKSWKWKISLKFKNIEDKMIINFRADKTLGRSNYIYGHLSSPNSSSVFIHEMRHAFNSFLRFTDIQKINLNKRKDLNPWNYESVKKFLEDFFLSDNSESGADKIKKGLSDWKEKKRSYYWFDHLGNAKNVKKNLNLEDSSKKMIH